MTFPVFASGDVLAASDMNAVGLWLVKTQTIGTGVSSVAVTNAFSTNYDSYRIIVSGGSASTGNQLNLTFGAAVTGYLGAIIYSSYGGALATASTGTTSIALSGTANATSIALQIDVVNPFLTEHTLVRTGMWYDTTNIGFTLGYLNNTTSYTDFTVTTNTGTLTGGTIRVYGYRN